MKISSTYLVLLTAGVYGVDARGSFLPSSPSIFGTNIDTAEALHTATVNYNGEDRTLLPQNNYNGWVNPEDLAPMPQCIAQQDQSTWLSTMTKSICTHHQWLTQLSCLSVAFSPNVIESYFPYCGRSVLAKAQLYQWVRNITGRTWLVDVGDANELQNLSPASLAEGYAAFDVVYNAPTCLTGSVSALWMEPFQHVMASCSFTSTTQHTGNAARPWEYSESLRSMITLDSETVGYNLVRHRIRDGDYFDKDCFCSAFTIDLKKEPCSGSGQLDFTKERLWINATCGSTSLPDNWTDILKTTQFAYIPIEDWHWPMCVADMPKQVIKLTDQCATDACELDSSGYCKVKRAVDRACFCRSISYDSCGGSCKIFETRIDYIKWLHDLCDNVQDWHGLPDDWRQLAAPTPIDMIPWRWTIKPSNNSDIAYITHLGYIRATETCASNEWKLGSFALVNVATFLVAFLSQRTSIHQITPGFLWHSHPWCWFFKGTLIATLQLLANWFNVLFVQKTPGYEDVPVIQLMLLWCSMPRLAWLTILLIGVQPFGAMKFSAAASLLFAEMILQSLSSYYMVMTVNYGREHNFYFGGMERAERGRSAKIMYAGALMWLMIVGLVLIQSMRATRRMNRLIGSGSLNPPKWQRGKQTISKIAEDLMVCLNELCTRFREDSAHYWMDESRGSEETPLTSSEGGDYKMYGTFSVKDQHHWVSQKAFVELYAATVISMLFLWIAQWLFWGGFIGLSSEEFCPPKLGVLTAVWIVFSLAGAIIIII
ncbi:uncharacterized protein ASPGLDRAFT_66762 [Aspergillus glaucus CBS 516.65]|uniref:Extracellular membrane protein CFEM domain-containing protein n=1 Tax=Aspergillus glaucus CBS 516.65 TaxID=1160497 RepID=A0A1L9VIQ2_ASPGL|nr:hypothetical protein ASPGLDRAFT_66762 [Aspergillus glaucus CBS 516.65]OJJ83808.1 hypothetical protein ASPGLDRAFT_66762 [Aspergillus glaucus CBS 516.65]